MADQNAELGPIVATLTGMIVELHVRQIALAGFLQAAGTLDRPRYEEAIRQVWAELGQRRSLAEFRSHTDARSLGVLEQLLRAELLPKTGPQRPQ